jgi:uncharacterized protein YecE (DUF72 family)
MTDENARLFVGCAGWSIPRQSAGRFPAGGTHLERYARRLPAVEINTSFYRPHLPATYQRWAAAVPEHFRFAVKVPRAITHERRLAESDELLRTFLEQARHLGHNLGPLLVQLPPSLLFDEARAGAFFTLLRAEFAGQVVCEPRHASWFAPAADALLRQARVSRVAADPAPVPQAAEPRDWGGLVYYRLHGSPVMYESAYSQADLLRLRDRLERARPAPAWCIFDNTALGAASENALALWEGLERTVGQ